MLTGSEEWQSAFTQVCLGNPKALQDMISEEVRWCDLYPLVSLIEHPVLEKDLVLERLFVLKNEHEKLTFGLNTPEVAAPLCFVIACHEKGLVDALPLLDQMPDVPELLVQVAMLPRSWCLALPSKVHDKLAEGLDSALEELIASKLKGGDFFAGLAARLCTPHRMRKAIDRGLRLSDSAWLCLHETWGPLFGDLMEVGQDGIIRGFDECHSESTLGAFLKACRIGVLPPSIMDRLNDAGLCLEGLPYPLSCPGDAQGYLAYALYQGAVPDHQVWIERTFVNALTHFFAQGDDQALIALQDAQIDPALKSAVINAWGAYRPSSRALLYPNHLDNLLGNDLGL